MHMYRFFDKRQSASSLRVARRKKKTKKKRKKEGLKQDEFEKNQLAYAWALKQDKD